MSRKKKLFGKVSKNLKRLTKDFGKSPLARAAKGKHTRGYI